MSNKLTTDKFIAKCKKVHGDKYDYSRVDYISSHGPVTIICLIHGAYDQIASSHLHHKAGCPLCSQSPNIKLSTNEFITRAKKIHENKYDYSIAKYKGTDTKVNIICPTHGVYQQKPSSHINSKQGCPGCGNNIPTMTDILSRCESVHGNKYDYSGLRYINMLTKVEIFCREHGPFMQLLSNHLSGTGCPFCSRNVSKPETAWLNSLNVELKYRNKHMTINQRRIKFDAFVPHTNTVYEFWGDFFHGNPSKFNPKDINPKTKTTYGDLFEHTQEKRSFILSRGFNLVEIWESDWLS